MTNTKEPRQWWIRKRMQKGINYAFDPDNVELCEQNAKHEFWIAIEKSAYLAIQEKLRIAREALVKIDNELTCSAAEFVPSIGAAFDIIDKALALINKTEGEK